MSHLTLLHQLKEKSAQYPDKVFFKRRNETLSYQHMLDGAERFARVLIEQGIKPGDSVALLLDNLPAYPIAYYGTLLARAAVVPLCPETRTKSLHRALAHSDAKAIIFETKNSRFVEDSPVEHRFAIGKKEKFPSKTTDWQDVLNNSSSKDLVDPSEKDLAAIMYTSGTTAAPKGVMLSHRNLYTNTLSIIDYLNLQNDERLGLVLPFFYSYGNSLLHTHMAVGGSLFDIGSVAFPAFVLKGIYENQCTGISGVPTTFARLLNTKTFDSVDLSSLRYITQAGGPMTPALTAKLRKAIPNVKVIIMYGQTEASPRLSYLPPDDIDKKPASIGIAIPGVELGVYDEVGNKLGPNKEGELVARGDNIMRGYLNDEEATKRALRPEGLRTGDLAWMDEDGYFYIIGRNNDMIKAGAHRIGPKEIESVIEELQAVSQSAVVGIPDELLGEAIAAFIVKRKGAELTEKEVLKHCFEQLPRFKIPAHIIFVDELPKTETGKLQRSKLRTWRPEEK